MWKCDGMDTIELLDAVCVCGAHRDFGAARVPCPAQCECSRAGERPAGRDCGDDIGLGVTKFGA